MNGTIDAGNTLCEQVLSKNEYRQINKNGEIFADSCAEHRTSSASLRCVYLQTKR